MANNKYPVASVSVSFVVSTTDEDAVLIAEVNTEDNNGISNFIFGGAAPKFRLYKSYNISEVHMFVSDGNTPVRRQANINESLFEYLTFAGAASVDGGQSNYKDATVGKPVKDSYTIANIQGNMGAISLVEIGKTTFSCSKTSEGPLDPVVGFCSVSYNTQYDLYELTGISKPSGFGVGDFTEYQVIVYIVGVVE